jgi:FixJ family two-component response regulator
MNASGTVFIVDDAAEVRLGLSRLLAAAGYSVRTFESADRFLQERDTETNGCLLLDVCMPGLSGFDLQRALVGTPYARPIIFLTGGSDIASAVQAMKDGAIDFLVKPIEEQRLFAAVQQALRRDTEQRLERTLCSMSQRRVLLLTPRERQVMVHIMHGLLNKQIAAELGTGVKTIKVHRSRVMLKMAVHSVPELIQLAMRAGVGIAPPPLRILSRRLRHWS